MVCQSGAEIKRIYDLGVQPRRGEKRVIGALWVLYLLYFYNKILGVLYNINEGTYNSTGSGFYGATINRKVATVL